MTAFDAIEHVVVLMMENRSFDNMLGYLKLKGGRGDIEGLTGAEFNTDSAGSRCQVADWGPARFIDEPCHEWDCVHRQMNLAPGAPGVPPMDGFVRDYEMLAGRTQSPDSIMKYMDASRLPVYDMLAREFCVCDHWYSSVPGPTWPNRLYSLAGHSNGATSNKLPIFGFRMPTIFYHVERAGHPWRYYAHNLVTAFLHVFAVHSQNANLTDIDDFYDDADRGSLPPVSWIEPDFGIMRKADANDDHPPSDVAAGQRLIARVYDHLRNGPAWEKTLLIINYDEHGGFYDHVPPPEAPDERSDFRRFGVRVPAFLVSPWVARGSVAHTAFDHTSALKTILRKFCADKNGNIPSMSARTDAAADVWSELTLAAPRQDAPTGAVALIGDTPMEMQRANLLVKEPARVEAVDSDRPLSNDEALMLLAESNYRKERNRKPVL